MSSSIHDAQHQHYDVAAYIWPSYHHEPRLAEYWSEGDGEWYTVRRGTARFDGHDMPKFPLLGHQDEADPAVMRQHVDLALSHGVNVFIMDWYWYDDAPCFERQLNEGLLPAVEGTDMRFYLMWANHDARTLWNPHTDADDFLFSAFADRQRFEKIWRRNIERYFKHPNYYCIDGKPVLNIYLPLRLMDDLGGIAACCEAFDWLQQEARRAGLPGVHFQATHRFGVPHEMSESNPDLKGLSGSAVLQRCGYASATHYQAVHCAGAEGDYVPWMQQCADTWSRVDEEFGTYFPHVSIGWDNTQRMPGNNTIVTNATPWSFEAFLYKAKMYCDAHPEQTPLVTINSWNEWTEGSYLLPDMRWGYSYLEAVRRVFKDPITTEPGLMEKKQLAEC